MTGDYNLDADRVYMFEPYSASVYVLTHDPVEPEGPSLPFGFVPPRDLTVHRDRLPEPWMWWQ